MTEEVTWIETYTGKRVNPMHLNEELICIEDIAHSLSLQCRFVGHCLTFYSIAEHCILVANVVGKELADNYAGSAESAQRTCLAALLHDAAEAYIGDISRPVKHFHGFGLVLELEHQILGKVMRKFGCIGVDWGLIKKADDIMLATEAEYNMASSGKGWYIPELPLDDKMPLLDMDEAEEQFLLKFRAYSQ